MTEIGKHVIDARPTKEFFIFMLTKDIKLIRSIIDLVDNSWDGAIRVRRDVPLQSLSIRIEADSEHFRITDNCGGIPLKIAENYAFRFGRPRDMPSTDHSVGQFGVGMKRTLFKLGTRFAIESHSQDSSFSVDIDVNQWVDEPEWQFTFKSIDILKKPRSLSECSTTITVTSLHEIVRSDFESPIFITQLKEAIQQAHQQSINEGISITLNKVPLNAPVASLSQSAQLKPAHKLITFDEETKTPVAVSLYAGIGESDPHAAGWSVFCNGRLVLDADGSLVTGWGEGQGKTIPRYHNQFARFRGYAFFDSDDATKLPWNTTKTGVDSDSRIYQATRLQMIQLMRPVIDFLNRLDAEKDDPEGGELAQSVERAKTVPVTSVTQTRAFVSPSSPLKARPTGPRMRRIQYDRSETDISKVMKSLNVTSLKDVGIGTFEYYLELECE